MLIKEYENTYDEKIGDTIYSITSECDEDTKEDILEAIVRLIKRDIAGVETEQ